MRSFLFWFDSIEFKMFTDVNYRRKNKVIIEIIIVGITFFLFIQRGYNETIYNTVTKSWNIQSHLFKLLRVEVSLQ
jgi:hypothetical protein